MAENTSIEWTDATWNPIRARNRTTGKVGWFCSHASPGCINCYAENMNRRLGTGIPFKAQALADVEIFVDEDMLRKPLRWRGPKDVFVCSMTDLFGEFMQDEEINQVFGVMALTPHLIYQVLTKRPDRMRAYCADRLRPSYVAAAALSKVGGDEMKKSPAWNMRWPLPNVWLGASIEDQRRCDERLDDLAETPAAVRFISYEPALENIDFGSGLSAINWLIYGDESGPKARPADEDWARSARDQCARSGTAFFLKQRKVGRQIVSLPALDGVIHDARPEVRL